MRTDEEIAVLRRTMSDVRCGVSPDVQVPACDLFLAFDVFEHSLDHKKFLHAVSQLLSPSGLAIILSPIEFTDVIPPFGEMHDKTFDDTFLFFPGEDSA
jgi:hypothetical protein